MIIAPDVFNNALYNVYESYKKREPGKVDTVELRHDDHNEVAEYLRAIMQDDWDAYVASTAAYKAILDESPNLDGFLIEPFFHAVGPDFGADLFGGEKLPEYTPPERLSPELVTMRDEYYAWLAEKDRFNAEMLAGASVDDIKPIPPYHMIWNNPMGDNEGFDAEGFPIDDKGVRIGFNSEGAMLNAEGQILGEEGFAVNAEGQYIDAQGAVIPMQPDPPEDINMPFVSDEQAKSIEKLVADAGEPIHVSESVKAMGPE